MDKHAEVSFTYSTDDGGRVFATNRLVNEWGYILPNTGGISDQPFLIGGGALAVSSACLLLSRRRKHRKGRSGQ